MTTSTPEFHNRRFIMRPTGSLCGLKSGRCQSWRRSRRRDKLQVHQGPYMANVLSDRARLPILSLLFVAFVIVPTLVDGDRKSTRLNSSHVSISYAVFC